MRERAFADDTGVALDDREEEVQLDRLFKIAGEYSLASGSMLNIDKTVGLRFGTARAKKPHAKHSFEWYHYGEDPVPQCHKYLGNAPGTPLK